MATQLLEPTVTDQSPAIATAQRLSGLTAGMAAHSTGLQESAERAGIILGLQVRQQAFTLAISDSFMLLAWSAICCLIVVACMANVPTQYRHVVEAVPKPA